jgi:acyl-homoserine-lactone acylase
VPHVYGTSDEAVFRGFGRAQAQAHGDLVLRLYGQARGRAAEYWGEEHVPSDRWVRTVDVPGLAERWLAEQSPEFRGYLEAFAGGFNAYALEHPEAFDEALRPVLPVEPVDVLAHSIRAIQYTFVSNAGAVRMAQRVVAQRVADRGVGGRMGALRLSSQARASEIGSNAWAVGPSRSASGNAMLLVNPHLPWGDIFTWFEAHLVAPGLDVTGATLVGIPVIAVGFNDRLGWTHTVNTYDGADLYVVEATGDGESYLFDGEERPFDVRTEVLRVRTEAGYRVEEMTVRNTVHGPVLAREGDRAVALRVAGLDASGVEEQWWEMGRARSLEAFEAQLRRLQIPMFNVVYADADGHILYLFNGRVPRRSRGDFGYWAGPVAGDSSTTLWTDVLPYDSLPRLLDPSNGWIQNANDPPWTATVPQLLDPAGFPEYVAPSFMGFRPQRSAGLLMDDASITYEEMIAYKHSTRMLLADRILDDLLPGALESADPDVVRGARVLESWDRTADAESRGGVLFEAWVRRWWSAAGGGSGAFAQPWDPERPVATPDGIASLEQALDALGSATRAVEEAHGAADVPWGEVHRLRVGARFPGDETVPSGAAAPDLPANGSGGDPFGVFRVVGYDQEAEDGTRTATSGDSYVAAVEFTPEGLRARTLLTYGNWSRPGSSHRGDQLELFSRKELRPAWRSREEVEANTERREEVPGPGG